jgi:O-antigen ligase
MRFSLRLLQLGAIAVVLVVSTHTAFELDRFLVPKEIVLHACAFLAGLFALRAMRRVPLTWVDGVLAAYLLLSVISAALATNRWLGLRALAVSASAVALFWIARAMRDAGLERALLGAIAFAVVLASILSLLQTYGIETDLFARSRAPGGTLGNRNFVGHAAAFGLPVVLLAALRAVRAWGFLIASLGVAIVTATLVLTRSRAAWLAAMAVAIVFLVAIIGAAPLRRHGRTWVRLGVILVIAAGGVAAALLIPNTLRWRSDNPYLESLESVASYEEGSGRGRLVQYEQSLRMAVSSPLVGVGPGNWPVQYANHAVRYDPSLNPSEGGMTFNPWPSSDWVAFIAERGFIAGALMIVAFAGIALGSLRKIFTAIDIDASLRATTLLGTLAGAGATGAFDAVLLLALPALLVWTTVGVLWDPPRMERTIPLFVPLAVLVLSAIGVVRSTAQIIAIELYSRHTRASLERASQIDPGNYRVQLRLARMGKRSERCEHALAAHALFPTADAARDLTRRCE